MEFVRSNLLRDHTSATEKKKIILPERPLSHLIISLDGYNATDETTLAEFLAFMNTVKVSHSGVTINSMQSEDLYGVNSYLYHKRPVLTQKLATDNLNRCLSLIVPFGREIMNPEECYPAVKEGKLTLEMDMAALATSIDNGTINVECVELPDANPTHFLKAVMSTVSAPGATGDNDWPLPEGNEIIAIQIRMTTWPGASSHAWGVDMARVLVNNKEYGYAAARAQCLVGDLIHHYDTQHGNIAAQGLIQPANVVYLDFDPRHDNQYLLDTVGKTSVKLRMEMGVDEATYVTVLERVAV